MILATRGRNVEMRQFETVSNIPLPGSPDASWGGKRSIRIAAVATAVRLVSETIGCFVMRTYRGDAMERQPVLDSPQARLFQEPAEGCTSFDLWQDTAVAIELGTAAFLWKVKTPRDGVIEIFPVDPDFFMVERDRRTTAKRVWGWIEGQRVDVTDRVIHIRGWSPIAGDVNGLSPIALHKDALNSARTYEEYRGRYFANDATPGIVLSHPGNPNYEQRRDLLRAWVERHRGPANAGVPGIVWGGVTIERASGSMLDAQGAQMSEAITADVARMFRIYPRELMHLALTGTAPGSVELWADTFYRFSLMSRMRRITRGLAADRDVFPDPRLYPAFDMAEFLRGDVATMTDRVHKSKQVGLITANEGRADMGYPPHPDGDELLVTPVGGAPNAAPSSAAPPAPDPEPEP